MVIGIRFLFLIKKIKPSQSSWIIFLPDFSINGSLGKHIRKTALTIESEKAKMNANPPDK